jgi:hypothetical protein
MQLEKDTSRVFDWFLIGMALYIFPPRPKTGDFDAMKQWQPVKLSFWETLKFRLKCRIFRYTAGTHNKELFNLKNNI